MNAVTDTLEAIWVKCADQDPESIDAKARLPPILWQMRWPPPLPGRAAQLRRDGCIRLMITQERVFAWLCSSGSHDPSPQVACLLPAVRRQVALQRRGMRAEDPVSLPRQVQTEPWRLIVDYCSYHLVPGRSDKERKAYDERFIRLDTRQLCGLASAADALDLKPLVDLSRWAPMLAIGFGTLPDEPRPYPAAGPWPG